MSDKKIFIPRFKGRIFQETKSKVLRSGNIQQVTKRLDENKNPVKDEKGRLIWDKTGDKHYIKVIEFENDEGVKKLELCLSLGLIYDNHKTPGSSGTDQSGPITIDGSEMKYAAWYVEDGEYSGKALDVTISKVINQNNISVEETGLDEIKSSENTPDEDYPF